MGLGLALGFRVRVRVRVSVRVVYGFLNFFDINFDRLHFSKHTDQCVRITPPEDF